MKGWKKVLLIVGACAVFLCVLVGVISNLGGGSETSLTPSPTHTPRPTSTPRPTHTPLPTQMPTETSTPTNTSAPTDTPAPTNTPAPTATSTSTPQPVTFNGTGQYATDPFTLPAPVSVAHFTHSGSSNFIVEVYTGNEKDLLINTIGAYDGYRPLVSLEQVSLNITADGGWSVQIDPIGVANTAAFSGRGDAVSGLFDPPASGAWEIAHNGKSNFIVFLHCAGGSRLIQNEIGPVTGSTIIQFAEGPCFWEVQADGAWSLSPRQ